jgi:hypothetical protein
MRWKEFKALRSEDLIGYIKVQNSQSKTLRTNSPITVKIRTAPIILKYQQEPAVVAIGMRRPPESQGQNRTAMRMAIKTIPSTRNSSQFLSASNQKIGQRMKNC